MKRIVTLIVLLGFVALNNYAQDTIDSTKKRVKLAKICEYDTDWNCDENHDLKYSYTEKYNRRGQKISSGGLSSKELWQYDNRGNLIGYFRYSSGTMKERIIYKYDDKNRKIEESYKNGEMDEYTYDEVNLIEICHFKPIKDSEPWGARGSEYYIKFHYSIDSKGFKHVTKNKLSAYSASGKRIPDILSQEICIYDTNENLIEKSIYEDSKQIEKTTYQYDGNNNLISEDRFINNNMLTPIVYMYDENNNLIEKTNSSDIYFYEYNENGDVITIRYIDISDRKHNRRTEIEYEYYN